MHVAVLDAVVHHLHKVPGAFGADVGDARPAVALGGDLREDRLEMFVSFFISTGHQAWTQKRAFFATAHSHTEEMNSAAGEFARAALGVGEQRIPAIDDDIPALQQRPQLSHHRIDRGAGFDHDQDSSRARE